MDASDQKMITPFYMRNIISQLKKNCWAAASFVPLTKGTSELPSSLANALNSNDLASLFNALFQLSIVVGSMIAVLRLAYAGFLYMTSDIFSQKDHAKTIIKESLTGLLILVGMWIILHQINPDILKLNILQHVQAIPTVGGSGGQSAQEELDPDPPYFQGAINGF